MTINKRSLVFLVSTLLVLPLTGSCQSMTTQEERNAREAAAARATKGKALFEEKCRTTAGERIHRTISDIEGVVLLKIRPARGDRELADQMWPGAAFARESPADEYIKTFLGYEHSSSPRGEPVTSTSRGYIGTDFQPNNPSNLPGYRFVDVIDAKDGQRYRYTGSEQVVAKKDVNAPAVKAALQANPKYDLNIYRYTLKKQLATEPSPRYGVTFEDHVAAEERILGIASSTIKVVDLQSKEVLGELTRYAWSPGGPSAANPTPWLTAYRCPDHAVGTNAATRKFADQILIPKRGK
jgi:hypothetical protein